MTKMEMYLEQLNVKKEFMVKMLLMITFINAVNVETVITKLALNGKMHD